MEIQVVAQIVLGLGTLGIAGAVFEMNRRQLRWSNQVAARAAAVDDQRFRLALLERREAAIVKVREAVGAFWQHGRWSNDEARTLSDALRIAELVFEDAERDQIDVLLQQIHEWQSADRRQGSYRDREDDEGRARYQLACDDAEAIEQQMFASFDPLLFGLRDATRIRSIKPITQAGDVVVRPA